MGAAALRSPAPVLDETVRGRLPLWPVAALLAYYPVWWALGLSGFAFVLMAIPMTAALAQRRPLRFPPGSMIWALFLVWVAAGVLVVNEDVPGTLPVGSPGRYLSFGLRYAQYLSVTVLALYIYNLTDRELPLTRLVRWLGVFFLVVVAGGLLGLAVPELSWRSPLSPLLPGSIRSHDYVKQLLNPHVAQIQDVLGAAAPRPSAPFAYTNDWGNALSLLAGWFVLWTFVGAARRRALGVLVLAVAMVPVVYSLNRGLWLGIGVAVLYVAVRLALRGRLGGLVLVGTGAGLLALALAFSPLGAVVQGRIENPHSNVIRQSLATAAVDGARLSPVLGWGSGREVVGSARSIAVGATAECPQCGNRSIGSQGQLWLVLFSHGFVGLFLYVGTFLYGLFRFCRDHSPLGIVASLGLLLPLVYMFVYAALTVPLAISLISLVALARNERTRLRLHDAAHGWTAAASPDGRRVAA